MSPVDEATNHEHFDCRCNNDINLYLACYLRDDMLLGALNQMNRLFFEVLATEAFNKSTFYCAAYERHNLENSCSCGTEGRCYSRPALLTHDLF